MNLYELIDRCEADAAQRTAREAMMSDIYAALDAHLDDGFGAAVIENAIDSYLVLCGFVAARAALLDRWLGEYQTRLEQAMRGPRTFIGPSYQLRKTDLTN